MTTYRAPYPLPPSVVKKTLIAAVLTSLFYGPASAQQQLEGAYFHIPVWGLKLGDNQLPPADPKQPSVYAQAGKALLKVTPARVDLSTRGIGEVVPPIPVTLTNIGRESVKIGGTSTPHQYSADQACEGAILPPLASCTFKLELIPVDTQKSEGYVDTWFSAGNDSAMASLYATAKVIVPATGSPAFSLSKTDGGEPLKAIDFGETYIGDASVSRQFTLKSTGDIPLRVMSFTPSEDFKGLAVEAPCLGSLMEPNTSCTVTASMTPLTSGAKLGALTLRSNSHEYSEFDIPLTATVSEWARRLDYQSVVDFGITDQGLQAKQQILIRNTGNLPVSNITPTISAPFVISSNGCGGVTLNPQESCTVTLTITGLNIGEVSGTFKLSADNLTSIPPETTVTANVHFRAGTFSPLSLSYGERAIGLISAPQRVEFTNNSSIATKPTLGALDIPAASHPAYGSNYKILQSHPWVLVDETNCSAPVAPSSSCSIQIAVSPTHEGPLFAQVTAYPASGMTARGSDLTITAHGTKQAFIYAPTLLDFGPVAGKTSVSGKLEITNTSIDAATLEGLSYSIEQPSRGLGTLRVISTTCDNQLKQQQGKCVFNFRLDGASHAVDETVESTDAVFKFRYSGAGSAYTNVPVKFLLKGGAPVVTIEGDSIDFGEIPVGLNPENAPRKLITVTNPGDSSFEITGVSYPQSSGYSVTAAIDSAYPNSCHLNSAIAPKQTCVLALYPTSSRTANWGPVEASVQLETRINEQTKPFGPLLKMKAVHLKPETNLPEVLSYTAGEHKSFSTRQPYAVVNEAGLSGSSISYSPKDAIGVHVQGCSQFTTQSSTSDKNCYIDITAEPQAGNAKRTRDFVINANSGGQQVALKKVTVNVETELAQYAIEGDDWNFGQMPAQGYHADNAAMSRSTVIRNTSQIANIVFNQIESDKASYGFVSAPLNVGGENLPACENFTLAAGKACHWTVTAGSASGALVESFEHTAVLRTNNDFGNISKTVSATYLPGQLEVVSQPQAFVNVPSATLSAPQVLVLRNSGKGNVSWGAQPDGKPTFSFVDASGAASTDFKFIVDSVPVQSVSPTELRNKPAASPGTESCLKYSGLAPNATCSIEVAMSPTGMSRDYAATLAFNARLPESMPLKVSLEGNSLAAEVYFSSQNFEMPDDMALGVQYLGQIVVGNGGDFPLQFNSVLLKTTNGEQGRDAEELLSEKYFSKSEVNLEHNCPVALEPGEECTLQLNLAPDRNTNWLTAEVRPYATLNESTYGVLHRQVIGVQGESKGGTVVVEPLVKELDGIEANNVPTQSMYTVKVTATGSSPVRFTSASNSDRFTEIVNSSCSTGLTLSPGDMCTFDVNNRSALHTSIGSWQSSSPRSFQVAPFEINGSVVDHSGKIVTDRKIQLTYGGKVHQPPANPVVAPSIISASRPLPTFITHSAIREGAKVSVDGEGYTSPANIRRLDSHVTRTSQGPGYGEAPLAGIGAAQLTLPANLAHGVHVAKVKNPGVTAPHDANFNVADFKLALPGEGEDVYTTVTAGPISAYSDHHLLRTFPQGGGVIVQSLTDPYDGKRVQTFSIVDSNGFLTGTVKGADTNRAGAVVSRYTKAISDTELVFLELTKNGSNNVIVDTWRVTHSGASDISVSLTGSITLGQSADTGSIYWDSGNDWVVGLQNNGNLWVKGAANGVAFEGPAPAFGSATLSGIAIVDGHVHAMMGSNIYVANPTLLSEPSRYVYTSVFNEGTGNQLYYSPASKTLISSCYAKTALCTIPTGDGALGAAKLEAGLPAQAGLDDGTFADARLAISYLLPVNSEATAIGFQSSMASRSTRLVNLSAIPAWGAVDAIDTTFTASIADSGHAKPHVITLTNKSSLPLNVTGLSIDAIPYTTTCNNIGYNQRCTVTVTLQQSMWRSVLEGAFAVKTSVNFNVPVKWKVSAEDANRDPHWANVVYLMNMEPSSPGSTTLVEVKNNAAVELVGSKAIRMSTSKKKFGEMSAYISGTTSGLALPPFNPKNDFTFEFWYHPEATTGNVLSMGGVDGGSWQPIALRQGWPNSGYLNYMGSSASSGTDISCPTGSAKNITCGVNMGAMRYAQWNHVAVVRSGPQYLLYLNGTRQAVIDKNLAPAFSPYQVVFGGYPKAGTPYTYSYGLAGYLDEVRVTDGVARYKEPTYTVPAKAFPTR